MNKEKLFNKLKKLGKFGAVISCFVYSDAAIPLFRTSGLGHRYALLTTVLITNVFNLVVLLGGDFVARAIGFDPIDDSLYSLLGIFITTLLPTVIVGPAHTAALIYAAQLGTWPAYLIIIVGTTIRFTLIDLFIESVKWIIGLIKKWRAKKGQKT